LLYTSLPVEGFANSFLQAWFREVPTISYTFDLDGIIEQEGIGRCAGDFDELVDSVDELLRDHAQRRQMGIHAREYAVDHFSVDRMLGDYEALFEDILN
jgi:glycosyltransferase involved in cell wall biosynthesis